MKNLNNQRLQMNVLATIATLTTFGALTLTFAQSGIGAKYGTRDPRICADTKAPTSGAMTPALAIKYLISGMEGVKSDDLYLIEGLTTVQVGGAVPYNPQRFPYASDIDVKAPVYPLRIGSYKQYQCAIVNEGNKGYNCNIYPSKPGTGVCVKTTFGDWRCTADFQSVDRSQTENNVPPPDRAKALAAGKPTAAKNGNQTAAKTDANQDEGGLPAPDFSDMEKYFNISKIEYSTADGYLYFIGKMTKKVNAVDFQIDFYDEDGIKVIPANGINPKSGDYSEVGDIAKYYGYLPPESKWKYVKKVVITKHIY